MGTPNQTPSDCHGHTKLEGQKLARSTPPAFLTAPKRQRPRSWPCWQTPQQGGELWTGNLLPVVQATLRVKRVPETPNYLHPLESVAKHNSAHCHNSNKITSSGPVSSSEEMVSDEMVPVVNPSHTHKGKEVCIAHCSEHTCSFHSEAPFY